MNEKIVYYFITIFIFLGIAACVIPTPIHKIGYESLSETERALYNDAYEIEGSPTIDAKTYSEVVSRMGEVTKLDWFDVVDNFFTKYTLTARVIDVQTKKSYYVRRVGGYYHADIQPITAGDTAIMKSIYANEWSWTRRPVWIEIKGSYVAASINGMPHGYSLIEGNNMDGHTCIHFLNSMTHGTKRVDEAHQAAVAAAYERRNELYELLLTE